MFWDIDPVLFELGPLSIKWYGLLFATAFLLGTAIMTRIYRTEGKPEEDIGTLTMYMMVATVVGARLGHCLFYDPGYYLSHPLEILQVWKGGLASHGGAIGITIGILLYSRKRVNQPFLWLLDRIVIPASIGGSLIRFGNFFNSEIVGNPSNLPWAVTFARLDLVPRHPAQLYEATAYVIIFIVLGWVYKKNNFKPPPGKLTGLYLVLVFSVRILVELVKTQQEAFNVPFGLSVGQLLSIPAVIIGLVLLTKSNSYKWSV
ncbi:MAG: prolipoprotein diacylglyceryl transferase [Bacteroidetes bacterium]|nr:prolipoprotein diacylglyceryl transferase [Bacteroidota bacterium]